MEGWIYSEAPGDVSAPFGLEKDGALLRLDWRPAVRWLREQSGEARSRSLLATGILRGLIQGILDFLEEMAFFRENLPVVLSGGVWQNRVLLEDAVGRLTRRGYHVLVPRNVSPNDEGLALGQVAVAAARKP